MDLRFRVIAAIDGGLSRRAAAARYGVAPSTAVRWGIDRRLTGSFTPKPQAGNTRSRRLEAHAATILAVLEETPDITLEELCANLARHGAASSTSSLSRFFRGHGIPRKKKPATRSSRTARTS